MSLRRLWAKLSLGGPQTTPSVVVTPSGTATIEPRVTVIPGGTR